MGRLPEARSLQPVHHAGQASEDLPRLAPLRRRAPARHAARRDRELAILRTAWHRESAYEWARHSRIARDAGLTDEEIESVRQPGALWQVEDRLVLQVADDLHAAGDLTDATWAALCDRYDEMARIELVMLVAHYDMLAMVLNALRAAAEE